MPECDPPVWCPIYCCLVGAESSRTLVRLVLPGQLKKCSESNGILSFWFMVPQGSAIFWNSSRPWELRCKYLGGPAIKKPWVDWLMDKINNSSPGCPTWNEKRGGKKEVALFSVIDSTNLLQKSQKKMRKMWWIMLKWLEEVNRVHLVLSSEQKMEEGGWNREATPS